jgi:hypothetical protein
MAESSDLLNLAIVMTAESYNVPTPSYGLMDVEAVQKTLGRSRASIYRYANTDPQQLNLSFDPRRLNPELRQDKNDPILFHPTEVSRFARDVLKISQVTIQVQEPTVTATNQLLQDILTELRSIRSLLEKNQGD